MWRLARQAVGTGLLDPVSEYIEVAMKVSTLDLALTMRRAP
jgi:hypothetical protein